MTVATLVSSVSYIGNGTSTIFTYPFYLIDAAHLQVWVNGLLQPANAYVVNSVGNQFGGEVVLSVAPGSGIQVDLRRLVPATQLVDYRPYDPFPAETHEQALDKLTMIVQGTGNALANAVRAPYLEPVGGFNLVLPAASVRANLLLGFDATGNVITYPNYGPPPDGITDHGQLSGLADDDHPQYMLRADLAGSFLPLTGGTMTGAIQLPFGFPTSATEAVNKAYVDTFVGSVITKNIVSDLNGDGQGTVEGGWNTQANAVGITRASNEIIYYRWKSDDTDVYRYVGAHQGPAGWATTADEWVASAGVNEAPLDGFIYGRKSGSWDQVVARAGGSYTGKVQGFAGAAAAADLARTDEVQALVDAGLALHVSALNPHPQYMLKTGGVITGPMLFADGTAANPGIAWANDPDTGLYRYDTNSFAATCGAAQVFWFAPGSVGTTSGVPFNAGGAIVVAGTLTGNAIVGTQLSTSGSAASSWWQDATNVFFQYEGARYWNYYKPTGDVALNLASGGFIFRATGDFGAPKDVYAADRMALIASDPNPYVRFTGDNWRLQWLVATGNLVYCAPNGTQLVTLGGGGNIACVGNVSAPGGYYIPGQNTSWTADANNVYLQMAASNGWLFVYDKLTGQLRWQHGSGGAGNTIFQPNGVFEAQCMNAINITPAWTGTSLVHGGIYIRGAAGRTVGRMTIQGFDYTPGADRAWLNFGIARNAEALGDDFIMKYNGYAYPQFKVRGWASTGVGDVANLPIEVSGATNSGVGICMTRDGQATWGMMTRADSSLGFGTNSVAGPGTIGGFSVVMYSDGNMHARNFYAATFAASAVQPMTRALADLAKLRGVRCFNEETQRPDLRLELDDIELVFPELVSKDEGVKSINYMALAAPIVEAIRELNDRLTALEAR